MSNRQLIALALVTSDMLSGTFAAVVAPVWAQTVEPPRVIIGDNPAAETASDLAKQIQNPVGDLISLPRQYNVNSGYGPNGGTQHVLNLQPVIPVHPNENWNRITRTILPIVWNPGSSIPTVPVGTAPVSFTALLSPSHDVSGWLWGAGPSTAVVYSGGPWVAGVLVNNIFSLQLTMMDGRVTHRQDI